MKIRRHIRESRRHRGFTILEMVIVLSIIVIIMVVAAKNLGGVLDFGKETQVRGELNAIKSNLLQYKVRAGNYPTQAQGLKALTEKPTSAPVPQRWTKADGIPLTDPWENAYVYKFPGTKNKSEPEVISPGADKTLGTDDDWSSQADK